MQLGWQDEGACRTIYDSAKQRNLDRNERISLFFPEPDKPISNLVSQTCATCPVLETCREWSIRNQPYGYSGGMTERERSLERNKSNIWLTHTTQSNRHQVAEIPCPSPRGYKMHLRRGHKVVSLEKGGCGCLEEHRKYSQLTKQRRLASEIQGSDTLS